MAADDFYKVFNYIPLGLFVLDRSYRIVFWNDCMTEWTGLKSRDTAGAVLFDLYPHLRKNRYLNRLEILFEGGPPVVFSSQFHRSLIPVTLDSGETQVQHTVVTRIHEREDDPHILFMIEDLTEATRLLSMYKEAREEADKSRREAERANSAKSEFLANMSHEIRTPMNAILGFCEILEGSVTDPKHKKYIASIRSSGRALLLLINDILDLSKIEAGKLRVERKPFNPLKVFAEMERVFEKAMADKKLSFDLEISRNFPESIALDEVRLRQILLNLIGNAVKFTEKGRVRLTASCSPSGEGVGSITLAVEDTGIGVAPGEMEKIFEPFEQPAGQDQLKYGGTGLGLSITKRLVSAMSGSIKAWSEPGRGSVFTVEFRGVEIQALSPRTARESESAGPAVRFDRAVVLVADDIPSNREMICELLSGCGDLQFILAADGAEAVELAARAAPDIILMDIKMPKVDGIEAAESIKTNDKTKHIPIVAVTASVCKSTVKMKVLNSLFNACLFKPVSRQMLIGEMKKYLPHSVVDGKDGKSSGAGPAAESFDPREIKDPAGFAESLERKIVRQLDYAGKTMLMDKISALAEPLAEIGEKHSFQPFAAFAEEIKRQTDMFDVSALSDTLGRLAETIAKIQKERGGTVRK